MTPEDLKIASNKSNWRITQLPNQYYQTEYFNSMDEWIPVTRRKSVEAAEDAIDNSIEYFSRKLNGKTVVKRF